MNSKYLMLFGILLLAVSQLIGALAELNENGALTAWMESVATHPLFKIGLITFTLISMIAMPYFYIRAKKNPY